MKKHSAKQIALKKNIITVAVCLLFVISLIVAIFLSGYDWHLSSITGSLGPIGTAQTIGDSVPKGEKEDWDYFDDTVFVGDSHCYAMAAYGYLSYNHVFAKIGLHQYTALYTKCVYTSKTRSYTIAEALSMAKPGKVIVHVGINSILSYNQNNFYSNYRALINKIKTATPDSKIIIQSIFPVTRAWAERNGHADYNQYIAYANRELAKLAKELDCSFLHTYEALTDENGYLQSQFSSDGLHLSRHGYSTIFDYILSHPIVSSGYFTEIGAVAPPVIPTTSSDVTLPDLDSSSDIAQNETSSDIAQTESEITSSNATSDTSSGEESTSSNENASGSSSDAPAGPTVSDTSSLNSETVETPDDEFTMPPQEGLTSSESTTTEPAQ